MKAIKRILAALLSVYMVTVGVMAVSAAQEMRADVSVKVEGNDVIFPDQQPVIRNDRTLVPIRFIAESLGYTVDWNPDENTAVIDDGRIIMYIGTNQAIIDGVQTEMDTASVLIGNRTMVPLRVVAETLGCTVDWFNTNRTVLINERGTDGSEKSIFDRMNQSGLFWHYATDTTEYLTWKNNYPSLIEASDPSNYDSWWVERPIDRSTLANQSLDCSIQMRTFNSEELAQVKDMFYTIYPTKVEEAYDIMMQSIKGELWQTFYKEDSEWYPLYSAMPPRSGTFGMMYFDNRQVEMYVNSTCTRLSIMINKEGYENPEEPCLLTAEEIEFYTAQAKNNYCLSLWGLK